MRLRIFRQFWPAARNNPFKLRVFRVIQLINIDKA
jgi:hypothetical protein